MSRPVFVDQLEGQSFVQVLKPSSRNDHVIVGSRQSVRTVSINDQVSSLVSIRSMKSSSSATTAVAFHPTAEATFVSASSNGEVSVWYYGAHNVAPLSDRWAAHSRAIHAMDFIPKPLSTTRQRSSVFPGHRDLESSMLLTAGADGEINCWDLCAYPPGPSKDAWRKPILVGNLRSNGLRSGIRDIDIVLFNRNQTYGLIVAAEDGSVEYYESLSLNPSTLELKARVSVSTQTINTVRFDPTSDGSRFATGGKDSYIRLFRIEDAQLVSLYSIRTQGPVWALRWRPGGKYIAASQSVMDCNIYVWDLESRLMPAYVFTSHRDNVTDLFWIDRFHLLSCSRDNTIQMHAVKNAVIPIERMRTVNISISLFAGRQTITNVCDVVNRTRFEKVHEDVDVELMRLGFPVSERPTELAPVKSRQVSVGSETKVEQYERHVHVNTVQFRKGFTLSPVWIGKLAPFVTEFVKSVANQPSESSKCCKQFAQKIMDCDVNLSSQAETMKLLGWLLEQPTGSSNQSVIPLFVSKALEVYRETNDVVMVMAVGAIALFSTNPNVSSLMTQSAFIRTCRAFLDLLHRLDLWQAAAEHVFKSPIAEIRSISHMRTGINTSCGNCNREIEGNPSVCSKCSSRLSDCVLCGNEVRGLWVACEGCGHGGHLKHVDWWFSNYDVCPVPDCLHQCRSC